MPTSGFVVGRFDEVRSPAALSLRDRVVFAKLLEDFFLESPNIRWMSDALGFDSFDGCKGPADTGIRAFLYTLGSFNQFLDVCHASPRQFPKTYCTG